METVYRIQVYCVVLCCCRLLYEHSLSYPIILHINDDILQDLKKHNYYYWFAFPCITVPYATVAGSNVPIAQCFEKTWIEQLNELYFSIAGGQDKKAFFFVDQKEDGRFVHSSLGERISHLNKDLNFDNVDLSRFYVCFSDPSAYEHAGWPLRLCVAMLTRLWLVK